MRDRVLGVIVVAALVGCGGSDSDGGDSSATASTSAQAELTSEEFVRRVDAACNDTNPELVRITTALTTARDARRAGRASASETFDDFAALLRRASATTRRFVARLRAITVPERQRAFHDAVTDSVEKGLANLGQQVRAAEAQDAIRLRDLSVAGSVINARAKGLLTGHGGFRHCGRG